jgi:hypothetical protein
MKTEAPPPVPPLTPGINSEGHATINVNGHEVTIAA